MVWRLFKKLWGRPTTTARFRIFILSGSSLRQQPLLAGRSRVQEKIIIMYLFDNIVVMWIVLIRENVTAGVSGRIDKGTEEET